MSEQSDVDRFWQNARIEGKLNRLEVVVGQEPHGTVPPPVWASSLDPSQANADVAELLETGQLVTASALTEYEQADVPLPEIGDLAIVLDGSEHPRALVRTVAVTIAADHPDVPATAGDVVVERLELLYPRPSAKTRDKATR